MLVLLNISPSLCVIIMHDGIESIFMQVTCDNGVPGDKMPCYTYLVSLIKVMKRLQYGHYWGLVGYCGFV